MKIKKYEALLFFSFIFLIVLIAVIAFTGIYSLNKTNAYFDHIYQNSFVEWVETEQANMHLIAVHRAMKDVAISRNAVQLEKALQDVQTHDAEVNRIFAALLKVDRNNILLTDVIKSYEDWAPIRAKTIEYAKNNQYEQAAENTRTNGSNQVNLISGKMQTLIDSEKDEAEKAYQASKELTDKSLFRLLWLAIIAILISIGISIFITKKLTSYKNIIYNEKEQLRITFDSIGDGVITTDTKRNVQNLNIIAEEFTGWKTEDALGKPFTEVFAITSAITGGKAKDPVEEVLTTDKICMLENHTILTSLDGTKRHIADSAAPIKDKDKKTQGVVMVFRDVTEKRALQQQILMSEKHYRMLFNTMLNGYALHEMKFDEGGNPYDYRFVDINPAFEEMTGISKDACIGKTVKELMPETEQYWIDIYGKVVKTGESVKFENYAASIGKYFEVFAFSPMENHFATIVSDITQRKELQNKIFEEKEQLKITFESIGDGVITTDTNKNIVNLNKVAEEYTGWSKEEALGKPFNVIFDIVNEETGKPANDPVEEVLATDKACELENHTVLSSKDGLKRHISDCAAPIKDQNGKTTGVVLVFRDVTEKKLHMDEIKYLSYHDSLTGLYNRTYFESELLRIDDENHLPISLIMGDVNGLKILNDVYGHEAGDDLLKNISSILKETCKGKGIVARYGGDEFAIILPNTSSIEADKICENIKSSCENNKNKSITLSISLGLSTKTEGTQSLNALLNDAEDRMYTHKLVEGKSVRSTLISSLQKTLFEKSCETQEHTVRMMAIANKIGANIRLTQYEMDEMKLLTLLHDVGKIGISDAILNKPDKLTPVEWNEMKKHPEIGYRIAQSTPELAHISELILTHHEHWDGRGYPQGLSGDSIPKLSRLLAIIDTFDVMTHVRPYKQAVSKLEALEEIQRCSKTQFDPYLVEEFLKIMA